MSITPVGNGDTQLNIAETTASGDRSLQYVVDSNGSESIPWASDMQARLGYQLKIVSGEIAIPSADVLAVGTETTSTLVLSEFNDQHQQDVVLAAKTRGEGMETVTVPAGTFKAQVVSQDIIETAVNQRIAIALTYYLVPGVATVKSEARITQGNVTTSSTEVLRTMSKPTH